MKNNKMVLRGILVLLVSLMFVGLASAGISNVPGSNFPNTCAEKMEKIPKGDCSFAMGYPGEYFYAKTQWYKDAVNEYKETHLTEINFANNFEDAIGEKIYVNSGEASAWSALSDAIAYCPEIQQGLYEIKVYDNFCCRLISGGNQLSNHAGGAAIDINVETNPFAQGQACPTKCDLSPCILAAIRDNGFSNFY